jgi:hypothetical protein
MANHWDQLFKGIAQGGTSLAAGLFDKADKEDAFSKYDAYAKDLENSYAQSLNINKSILDAGVQQLGLNNTGTGNPIQDAQSQGVDTNAGTVQPRQQTSEDMYGKFLNFQKDLIGNPYAEQVGKLGAEAYNHFIPPQPKLQTHFDEKNNTMITYDEKGNIVKSNKYTTDDPKAVTPKDWEMNIDENGTPYWGVWKEVDGKQTFVKTADATAKDIQDYNDSRSEESKKPSSGTGHHGRIGSYHSPISFGTSDKTEFAKLKDFNADVWSGKELPKEQQAEYESIQKKLGSKYGLNFNQLAKVTEKLSTAKTVKEQDEIIQSLDKGTYHNDTSNITQQQGEEGRARIKEWRRYLDEIHTNEGYGEQWNIQVPRFLDELQNYYNEGVITLKEYNDLVKSYK